MSVYEELKGKDIIVLYLSLDDNEQQWLDIQKKDGICWLSVRDKSGFKNSTIKEAYKVSSLPTTFLINKEGEVVRQNPSVKEVLEY